MNGIIGLGDSIMMGAVLSGAKYKTLDNNFLNCILKDLSVIGHNYGHFGYTVTKGRRLIEKNGTKILDSDIDTIFIEYGGNDSDFLWKEISNAPENIHDPKTSLEQFTEDYSWIIDYLQSGNKNVIMLSLPPIDSEKYINTLSSTLSHTSIVRWLDGDLLFLEHWHEIYNLKLFEIARNTETTILDITTPFLATKNYTKLLCDDGIHPNENGHRLIADAIKDLLKNSSLSSK